MNKFLSFAAITAVSLMGTANAASITSYDIENAQLSGFGVWEHTYSGSITPTGATGNVLGFAYTNADYAGGSGTLNDGINGSGSTTTQLFATQESPIITLMLDGPTLISDLTLFSFDTPNTIPGNISGLDITIGNVTETLITTDGMIDSELIDLSTSTLASLVAISVTLSNFTTTGSIGGFFAISEIAINGTPFTGSEVPLPAAAWFFLSGIAGLGLQRRKAQTA